MSSSHESNSPRDTSNLQASLDAMERRLKQQEEFISKALATKDETINLNKTLVDSFQKQNDALNRQLSGRWSLITGMIGFVGLMFAVNLGYEIYRVAEVMQAKRSLEDGARTLGENALTYSDVLSSMAQADSLISEAHREMERKAFRDAEILSAEAIAILMPAFEKTGPSIKTLLRANPYDSATCTLARSQTRAPANRSPAKPPEKGSFEIRGLSPAALRAAVSDVMLAAHSLHARAAYFAKSKSKVREDAHAMLALDSSRSDGYHWIGLMAMDLGNASEAITCFKRSVSQKSRPALKDHINLAELSFLQGNYAETRVHANAYLKQNYDSPKDTFKPDAASAVDVVAWFYLSLAEFNLGQDNKLDDAPKILPSLFRKNLAAMAELRLEGTFDQTELDRYLTGPWYAKLTPQAKRETDLTAQCLKKRVCDK